jgi:formylglycine-generating enzyme
MGMMVVAVGCGYPDLPRLMGGDAADAAADGPPQALSCMGLATTCGPGANDDCCRVGAVTGGTFYRGHDSTGTYPDMAYPATLSDYKLDVYEVTVGRFRAFVNAGLGTQASPPAAEAGAHPQIAGSGWNTEWNTALVAKTTDLVSRVKCNAMYQAWTDGAGGNENKAMNCVTWYEAMAFCIWDGGYLPTDAEWNYAASGGDEQRAYPWSIPPGSTTIDCTYANFFINSPSGTFCVNGTGGINRVGTPNGNGRWKQADLAGNVNEWILDWDAGSHPVPCNDCANLTPGSDRVLRGGSFTNMASDLRVASRDHNLPVIRLYDVGFRCARTL